MMLNMKSLFSDTFRKKKDYKDEFKIERWMETQYDNGVQGHHKLQVERQIVKNQNDEGIIEDDTSKTFKRTPH